MTAGRGLEALAECALSALLLACAAYYLRTCAVDVSLWNIDFSLRYNEVRAVLAGHDPYLVWKGILPAEGCVPFDFSLLGRWPGIRMIHVYPPWTYVPLLPFADMPYERGAACYRLLEALLLGGMLAGMLVRLRRLSQRPWILALAFAAAVFGTWDGVANCLVVGNFGIVVTFAVFAALALDERGHPGWAGACWALAAVKPQLAALSFLVLLLERKWRSLLVAGTLVAAEGLFVAYLCDRPFLSMVLSIRDYNSGMFSVAGLLPDVLRMRLAEAYGGDAPLLVNSLAGILLCFIGWRTVRRAGSLWLRFLPAFILSVGWSAYRLHDFSFQLLPVFVALTACACARRLRQVMPAVLLFMLFPLRMSLYLDAPVIPILNLLAFSLSIWLVRENWDADLCGERVS